MTVIIQHLDCYQGATFAGVFTWEDSAGDVISVAGLTAKMSGKYDYASTAIISLTTENSRITLGGAAGTITLNISATDTAALTAGVYVYDLKLIGASETVRIAQGTFTVWPQAST